MASQETSKPRLPGPLFGRVSMGYAVIESNQSEDWSKLLADCFGMHLIKADPAHLQFRLDERACRFLVRKGGAEDVAAVGLELADETAHGLLLNRLRSLNIAVEMHTGEEAELRGVSRFWRFRGPKNLAVEFFHEPLRAREPLKLGSSGFVTGDMGFGHMAVTTREPERARAFWEQIFDMRYTDEVHQTIAGVPLDFTFLRFNKRHHSVALASSAGLRLNPIRTQVQHLEVQVASLDDIGRAYRRCRELKIPIGMGVGQHPNDKAISFYAKTPSGFEWEYGWNPLAVEDETWQSQVWDRVSLWGHFPESQTILDKLGLYGTALKSLARKEYIPPVGA